MQPSDRDEPLVAWTAPPPTAGEVEDALAELAGLLERLLFRAAPIALAVLVGAALAIEMAIGEPMPWAAASLLGMVLILGPVAGLYVWLRSGLATAAPGAPRVVTLRPSGAWIDGRRAVATRALASFTLQGEVRLVLHVRGWSGRRVELRLDPAAAPPERIREALAAMGVPESGDRGGAPLRPPLPLAR